MTMNIKELMTPWFPVIKYNISLWEDYYAIMRIQKEHYKSFREILESHKQEISHD